MKNEMRMLLWVDREEKEAAERERGREGVESIGVWRGEDGPTMTRRARRGCGRYRLGGTIIEDDTGPARRWWYEEIELVAWGARTDCNF